MPFCEFRKEITQLQLNISEWFNVLDWHNYEEGTHIRR